MNRAQNPVSNLVLILINFQDICQEYQNLCTFALS